MALPGLGMKLPHPPLRLSLKYHEHIPPSFLALVCGICTTVPNIAREQTLGSKGWGSGERSPSINVARVPSVDAICGLSLLLEP